MNHWSEFPSEVREHTRARGPACSVGQLLEELHEEAREAVEKALASRKLTAPAIHRALRDRLGDDAPSPWAIGNHRRQGCRCGSRR